MDITAFGDFHREARVCIAGGWVLTDKKRPRDFMPSQFFIPPETMLERFADLPEALENTVEIPPPRCPPAPHAR